MPGTCLIIDDSRLMRRGLRLTLLREQLFDEVLDVGNGQEALELLESRSEAGEPLDLVLCDLMMPEVDGFAFLERIKEDGLYSGVPLIILTGQEDMASKVRALEQGASDYLTKPFEAAELVARVRVHQKIKALQDELQQANERLRELVIRDPLTGLFNRRYCTDLLTREFERACRHDHPLSVLIADVDHFKRINDTLGHEAGDRVLCAIGRGLLSGLRGHDVVARYGGEEFVVILPQTGGAEAVVVAERLRSSIAHLSLDGLGSLAVTVSVGVASYPAAESGADIEGVHGLLRAADDALYDAKEAGRNRVAVARAERSPTPAS